MSKSETARALDELGFEYNEYMDDSDLLGDDSNDEVSSQCPEMILNKIEKTFYKTYTGLKSFLQRFQICFSQNPSCKGMESTS